MAYCLLVFCLRNKDSEGKQQELEMTEEPDGLEDKENERKKGRHCVQEILSAQSMAEVDILQVHGNEDFFHQVGFCLLGLKKQSEKERSLDDIRKFCTTILYLELQYHCSSTACHQSLKNKLSTNQYMILVENSRVSLKLRCLQIYYYIRNSIGKPSMSENEENGFCNWESISTSIIRMFKLVRRHIDPVKDLYILFQCISLISFTTLCDPEFFDYFSSQFVYLWALSVFVPFTMSTLRNIIKAPLLCFGSDIDPCALKLSALRKNMLRITFASLLFPFCMGMAFLGDEREKEKLFDEAAKYLKALKMKGESRIIENRMLTKMKNIENNRKIILNIERLETFETSVQLILQAIMLVLYQSKTKTTRGLEAFFGQDQDSYTAVYISNLVFLVLSIFFSGMKTMSNIVSSKTRQVGDAFSLLSKGLTAFRALLTNTIRTFCVLFYFAPFLGLWDIYYHLQVRLRFGFSILFDLKLKSRHFDLENIIYK